MGMFKEVLYETHREVDLMLINCDKREFITRAELTIMSITHLKTVSRQGGIKVLTGTD